MQFACCDALFPTVKRQWGMTAAYKGESALTSDHFTVRGSDNLLSTWKRSLNIGIYQRSVLLNVHDINRDTSRVQSDLESKYGTCYKVWERTAAWAGDIARGKCRIIVNDASEVCQDARCLFWIWIFQILVPTWLSDQPFIGQNGKDYWQFIQFCVCSAQIVF